MSRLHQRLFRLNERIAGLAAEERQAAAELEVHRHLDDDAQRDAAVSGSPIGRLVADLHRRRERLEAKRDRLLARLG
jgi:hypothetical protein